MIMKVLSEHYQEIYHYSESLFFKTVNWPGTNILVISIYTVWMYIQLPCLIPLLFPKVLGHGSLALTSAFVFEAFIAHLINLFSGTRELIKQMLEKLGVSQTYRVLVSQKCICVFIACYFCHYSLDDLLTRLTLKE